ncbi:hypothetical protein GW17_00011116 [Ensete ventricosum]|nr:hypothetical protein GW17_00011116 [Ensete ventricosum]
MFHLRCTRSTVGSFSGGAAAATCFGDACGGEKGDAGGASRYKSAARGDLTSCFLVLSRSSRDHETNSVGFTWRADQALLESDPTHCISPHSSAGTLDGSAASIEAATRKAFVLVRPYRGSLSLSFRSDQRGS